MKITTAKTNICLCACLFALCVGWCPYFPPFIFLFKTVVLLSNKAKRTAHFQLQIIVVAFAFFWPQPPELSMVLLWRVSPNTVMQSPKHSPIYDPPLNFSHPPKTKSLPPYCFCHTFVIVIFLFICAGFPSNIFLCFLPALSPPPAVPHLPPTPVSNWISLPFPFGFSQPDSLVGRNGFCWILLGTHKHQQQQ